MAIQVMRATHRGKRPTIRVRGSGRPRPAADPPNLIEVQLHSYQWFKEHGLAELFRNFSPVEDYTGNLLLEFGGRFLGEGPAGIEQAAREGDAGFGYYLTEPKYSIEECRDRDVTYESPLKVKARLTNRSTGEQKESEVYLGELPVMTEHGTFVINGAERAVVSQLSRSPGVYFKDAIDFSGRILYSAQVIPNDGPWLDFDMDANDVVSVKIGQAHKFPATTLLRALHGIPLPAKPPGEQGRQPKQSERPACSTTAEICELFGERETLHEVTDKALLEQPLRAAEDVIDKATGEVICQAGQRLDKEMVKEIQRLGFRRLFVFRLPSLIEATLDKDPTPDEEKALVDIARRERPGDPVTPEQARQRLKGLFGDTRRYDLAKVGRHKINRKLGLELPEWIHVLTKEDVIAILHYLMRLQDEEDTEVSTDEIDHLQNKRVKCVGELLQNQFRLGFLRMERIARERMTSLDPEQVTPQTVISTKPVSAAIKTFFGSSQLSQFMDQTNPLAELTHKRRLSVLGPGGLSRQSAKLEVRDVHHSHYGRICPIETPEGPNIGLIGYLAVHARLNEYGFIETPYCPVNKGVVSMRHEDVVYMTADAEEDHRIAPADEPIEPLDAAKGRWRFVNPLVTVRYRNSFPQVKPDDIELMDLAPQQLVSVATSLIPFVENDDANRALMGARMQGQAVSLVRTEAPWVMTGLERRAAEDSGAVVICREDGLVVSVEANRIVVQRRNGEQDNYRLLNFLRSNQATCITQKPLVRHGQLVRRGQVLADGPCTDQGELALGRNILCVFMPWEGYNYEDAIVISDKLVRDDTFSSIHIEKYEIEARETKVGPEEITRDIPNVGDEALKDLDEDGVVRIGAEVRAEDILVGKVAPKGQEELTSEEKLVRAIFGEKAAEMRDTSLRVPHGEKGKVVDIKRFSRLRFRCSKCQAEYHVIKEQQKHTCDRCGAELVREEGDELNPGVSQLVRVYVAQQRKVMEGDKIAGRHGNKGVIAKIMPQEEMPFLADGTPVDIILNPLGVPSRMNIGQIMECHLGWASKELGYSFENPIFEGAREAEILERLEEVTDRLRRRVLHRYLSSEVQLENGWYRDDLKCEQLFERLHRHLARLPGERLQALAERFGIPPREWEAADGAEAQASLLVGCIKARADEQTGFDEKTGKCWLYDGRSGKRFSQPVTTGYVYMMKLIHLVEDKIHARSTGPYSLVTQQPLGGKAQFGGQRFGEMEVWALEAYGAAHTLQEILTIKSDDVMGRVKTYESIVKGEHILEPGLPESFKILIKELQSLGLQVAVESKEAEPIDLEEAEETP